MYEQPAQTWPDQPQPRGSNVLGIVGFVLAFCVSPLGLILSLAALAKPPRGFAVAGTVVGLIGTIVWTLGGFGAYYYGGVFVKGVGLGTDYSIVQSQIASYSGSHNGEVPADLASAGVPESARKDPWDRDYKFERSEDGKSWTFTSASFDGQFGTPDDAVFTNGMSQSDMQRVIGTVIEEHMKGGGTAAPPAPSPTPDAEKPADPAPAEEKKPE